jgi:hypothetical protein
LIVALLMPATSPSDSSSTSALKPLRSQYFRYWRSSIDAQSQASVPPAPAWMSMNALAWSIAREHAAEFHVRHQGFEARTSASMDSSVVVAFLARARTARPCR